ncbi:hypothetical protein CEXT_378061 [Caerostris extrusa]|uniref:Uncharacterized protein n=1 Tax=Caerostris extrusa TaxID=172846 RepID=A0AAV4XWY2_CAEEX|nr:hypothetical protein CEXT_378061 [Caerostris extrusa]
MVSSAGHISASVPLKLSLFPGIKTGKMVFYRGRVPPIVHCTRSRTRHTLQGHVPALFKSVRHSSPGDPPPFPRQGVTREVVPPPYDP